MAVTLAQARLRLISRVRSALGPDPFQPDPARDVFLVSYPRSGNTWMRTAIAILQTGDDVRSIGDLDYIVPDIHHRVPRKRIRALPRYIVKSHFQLGSRMPSARYRRVIHLVRDPRDCVVSYFRYLRHTARENRAIDEFVIDCLAGRVWPCSWQEHVLSWTFRSALPPNHEILTIRYEDFRAEPAITLQLVARFLRLARPASTIDGVVAATTLPRMREREAEGLRPTESSTEPYFVGSARSGDWRELLSAQSLEALRKFAGPAMEWFGYGWGDRDSVGSRFDGGRPVTAQPHALLLGDDEGVGSGGQRGVGPGAVA